MVIGDGTAVYFKDWKCRMDIIMDKAIDKEMDKAINFENLKLGEGILKALKNMGFEKPSEVQSEVIPLALEGVDIIVKSQTGTGKTAAFGIPICENMDVEEKAVQALILTPTRELAVQVAHQINNIGRFNRIRSIAIYGGQPIAMQTRALKQRIHVIVGTPGRVIDHIEKGNINLSKVRFMVIDEADEMFDMGFAADVESIVRKTPHNRQMMLFSATISEKIEKLTGKYMKEPKKISLTPNNVTVDKINQRYYVVDDKTKFTSLNRILCTEDTGSTIIFCNTKISVAKVLEDMENERHSVIGISGDMTQDERMQTMRKFKQGEMQYLVATDVAARGLDIDDITHVINYDIPLNAESYVHRIGRTARAGKGGSAITLVTLRELRFLEGIEAYISEEIPEAELPTQSEAKEGRIAKKMLSPFKKEKKSANKEKAIDSPGDITRLHISAGRKNKMRPGDIVGAIIGASGIDNESIGVIEIYDTYTYVDIMNGQGNKVLEALNKSTIKGKNLVVQRAKAKE
jgi:ATP-dependent RNA helicase DeaD